MHYTNKPGDIIIEQSSKRIVVLLNKNKMFILTQLKTQKWQYCDFGKDNGWMEFDSYEGSRYFIF